MKLDRKQNLNVLYHVCVFLADRKNKMAALASDWLRNFQLLLWNQSTEFNETWQEARYQRPLPSLCFSADRINKMAALASDCLIHFRLLLGNRRTEFNETWQEAGSQRPLPILCISGWWNKNKMATPASDRLRHFRLLLGNRRTEFNETWQEAGSQRPLLSLCISGWWKKTRWPPLLLIGWDILDFSSEGNSMKSYRKQDLNILCRVFVFRADEYTKMAVLADLSKRWHIVLRFTICGPLGLMLIRAFN